MRNLRDLVSQQLAGSSQAIQNRVVASLVEDELGRRTILVTKALQAYEEAEKKLRTIKPNRQSFDAAGTLVSESFSKAKLEEKTKTDRLLSDLSSALDKALDNNDWQQLEKLTKQG